MHERMHGKEQGELDSSLLVFPPSAIHNLRLFLVIHIKLSHSY